MNKRMTGSKFDELRSKVSTFWKQLTNNNLDTMIGEFEESTGLLLEKFGYTNRYAVIRVENKARLNARYRNNSRYIR